jgi:hypothetical protein
MSDVLPEDPKGPVLPAAESQAPVSPLVQGAAPAWESDPGAAAPSDEQLVREARARQALRQAAQRDSQSPPMAPTAHPNFTVARGGRSAMVETAGRIGTAVGNAQRGVRRTLELVRHPPRTIEFPAEDAAQVAGDEVRRAERMMHEIDQDAADLRQQAGRALEDWSAQAEDRFAQLRRQAAGLYSRSLLRAQELAEAYPLQTIAAVAGTCFVFGAALRLRRSRRG